MTNTRYTAAQRFVMNMFPGIEADKETFDAAVVAANKSVDEFIQDYIKSHPESPMPLHPQTCKYGRGVTLGGLRCSLRRDTIKQSRHRPGSWPTCSFFGTNAECCLLYNSNLDRGSSSITNAEGME